ncbi:MAG: ATP-dependent metallopeptidase FtsH/Yme1/Tma family protein [Caldilineae bacterium]|nr:MAG: ATP-dependent metallopeptidase FtsH/Yme1/Tma family protein [Caldilineae bacterium]
MDKRDHQSKEFRRQSIYSIAYFVFTLLLLLAINTWSFARPRQVPYSQFLQAMERGEVKLATISDRNILWQTGDGDNIEIYQSNRIPGVDDSALIDLLHQNGVEFAGIQPNPWLSSLVSWLLPLAILGVIWYWSVRRLPGATQYLSFGRSRARIWDVSSEKVTFDDVAGVDEAVTELREVVEFLKNPDKYAKIGARIPKGVLLVGPPGTGKTLLAKATAGEANVPFFSISGADFVEMFVGVGAARVRDLFRQAREKAPCIVFIDEIDAIGRSRAGARSPVSNEEREQTLNQLLVEMDGFDSSVGVIIMAATNRPEILDKALMRPGRFDRQVVVDKPDLKGREAILRVHTRKVALADDVDLHVVAARTPGFAGAELANLVNEAALLAVRNGREKVSMDDFDEAVDRVMAGLERKSRALNPKEREIVAYHEMGHALTGTLLPNADPVHKISIVPRGVAALGVTIQTPLEDRYLLTEDELRDRITTILGGRAAEEVIYGRVSTGPADDLQRATALARRMVTQFGMSDALGPIALEDPEQQFLETPGLTTRSYGDKTAEQIDTEVRALLSELYQRARNLLSRHKDVLIQAAKVLLEQEVMEGKDLVELLQSAGVEFPVTDI